MSVEFDQATGRLRLETVHFAALHDWALGTREGGPELAELIEADVLSQDGPHPAVEPAISAIGQPACRVAVHTRRHDGTGRTADLWVDQDVAALLLPLTDGRHELVVTRPDNVSTALARFVDLGPRQRLVPEPFEIDTETLGGLLDSNASTRRRAAEAFETNHDQRKVVDHLVNDPWLTWIVEVAQPPIDGNTHGRAIKVLDGNCGLFWVAPDESTTRLIPTSARDVWRVLSSALLPAGGQTL